MGLLLVPNLRPGDATMSLWWLEPGWGAACCAQCGANIKSTGGDPDWGFCWPCMQESVERRAQEQESESHRRAQEDAYYREEAEEYYREMADEADIAIAACIVGDAT